MSLRVIGLVLILCTSAGRAVSLSVEGAVQAALAADRELRAAREEVEAARARVNAAGRLADPEFQLEVAGGRDFEGRVEIGFAQRFPLTARLGIEKTLSRLAVEAAAAEVEVREREIGAEVREAYFRLAGARAATAMHEKQAGIGRSLADAVRGQASEGLSSVLEAGEAELESERLKVLAADASVAEIAAEEAFCSGLSLPADGRIELSTPLSIPSALPASGVVGEPPAIRLAKIAAEAARTDIRLAKAMGWDDVAIGLFVEGERFRDEPEGIETEGLLGMRMSVPLPLWRNTRAEVRAREAAAAAREERVEAARLSTRNRASAARRQMENRHRSALRIEREALPAARKLADETEQARQRGEVGLQDVLRIRARVAELEAAAIEAAVQYHIQRARWLDASGHPIQP